jgi:histone acetyltransferase
MNRLLSEMQNHASSWPFREPVKLSDAADYYEVIEQPMGPSSALSFSIPVIFTEAENFDFFSNRRIDLRTMGEKLEAGKYANLEEFVDDAQLIFDNCRFYNVEDSMWCKHANKLEKVFKDSLARLRDL